VEVDVDLLEQQLHLLIEGAQNFLRGQENSKVRVARVSKNEAA